MIRFDIPGKPQGKARARFTKAGHAYTPEGTRQHEGFVKHLAALAMQGKDVLRGAVSCVVSVQVEPPQSWSKKKRAEALSGNLWPVGKPDLDNIAKSICDACNGIVFLDDRQVVALRMQKTYGDRNETAVSFAEIG